MNARVLSLMLLGLGIAGAERANARCYTNVLKPQEFNWNIPGEVGGTHETTIAFDMELVCDGAAGPDEKAYLSGPSAGSSHTWTFSGTGSNSWATSSAFPGMQVQFSASSPSKGIIYASRGGLQVPGGPTPPESEMINTSESLRAAVKIRFNRQAGFQYGNSLGYFSVRSNSCTGSFECISWFGVAINIVNGTCRIDDVQKQLNPVAIATLSQGSGASAGSIRITSPNCTQAPASIRVVDTIAPFNDSTVLSTEAGGASGVGLELRMNGIPLKLRESRIVNALPTFDVHYRKTTGPLTAGNVVSRATLQVDYP